ncbi:hypothetical protein [Streptomyces sp. NPDC002187]|uniref:hypothetical protein n=1 Tax=Streptomyces sp. NPDC002187 TaxID=3364637 RepID=UPI00368558DE
MRERAEEPEAGARFGRLNLLAVGAVVTIVAALGGLVATGVGMIWSALVAADQLEQSREQHEDGLRAHASRVSYWITGRLAGDTRIHVMNRSPDPVDHVRIHFTAGELEEYEDGRLPTDKDVVFFVLLPSLPPCTETVIDGKSLQYTEGGTADQSGGTGPLRPDHAGPDLYDDLPGGTYLQLRGLNFVDRNGLPWTRMDGKLTQENRRPDSLGGAWTGVVVGEAKVVGEPKVRAVEACRDNGKG